MLLKIERRGRSGEEWRKKKLQEIARQFLPVRISVFSFFLHNKKLFFRNLFTWNIRNEFFSDLQILCSTIYPSFARPKRRIFSLRSNGRRPEEGENVDGVEIFVYFSRKQTSVEFNPESAGRKKNRKSLFSFLKLLFTHFRRLINFFSVWGGHPKE